MSREMCERVKAMTANIWSPPSGGGTKSSCILQLLGREKIRCDRGGGPLSICMLDIDRFKNVNDSLGHAAGDEVLRKSVRVAEDQLPTIDFMGRYGGEEFLVVLTQTEIEGARECAERVRKHTEHTRFTV